MTTAATKSKPAQNDDDQRKPTFFVLRAKGKELMLKMFDLNPAAHEKLANLKRRDEGQGKRSKERSKMIRVFI